MKHLWRWKPTPVVTFSFVSLLITVMIADVLDIYIQQELAGLRIIVTRLGNNMIDVYALPKQVVERNAYERQQYNVTKQDELVAVLQG